MSFMNYTNRLDMHNGLVGKLGEDFACEFLISRGHTIVKRNFHMKHGEIDIITSTPLPRVSGVKIHIVEVKTSSSASVRAEENMNIRKIKKVAKLGEAYAKNNLFSIDFVGVSLNSDYSLKKIVYLENLEVN